MKTLLYDVFDQQVNGNKFLFLFQQMAETITEEYISDLKTAIKTNGYPPSFEEVFKKLITLTTELNARADGIIDEYKATFGTRSVSLTKGCNKIIKEAFSNCLRQLNTIIILEKQNFLLRKGEEY